MNLRRLSIPTRYGQILIDILCFTNEPTIRFYTQEEKLSVGAETVSCYGEFTKRDDGYTAEFAPSLDVVVASGKRWKAADAGLKSELIQEMNRAFRAWTEDNAGEFSAILREVLGHEARSLNAKRKRLARSLADERKRHREKVASLKENAAAAKSRLLAINKHLKGLKSRQ